MENNNQTDDPRDHQTGNQTDGSDDSITSLQQFLNQNSLPEAEHESHSGDAGSERNLNEKIVEPEPAAGLSTLDQEESLLSNSSEPRNTSILKPNGHLNKPLIAIGALFAVFLLMMFFMPGSEDKKPKQLSVKTEKLPEQVDELSAVTPGDSGSANLSNSNQAILADTNPGNSNSSILFNSNSNSNLAPANTVTTTKTTTTYVPVEESSPATRPTTERIIERPERPEVSKDFTVDIESDSQNPGARQPNDAARSEDNYREPAVNKVQVAPGTKIAMSLSEPFRSGIETKVQAETAVNIKNNKGQVVIPSGSIFEITFRPDEVNGRVMARENIRVIFADGRLGELSGIIKGADGFAGLSGKLIKEGGAGLGTKILKGVARVGGRVVGSQTGVAGDIESEIRNNTYDPYDTSVRPSNRIVEVRTGTQFYLVITTP